MCCNVDDLLFLCLGNLIYVEVGFVVKGVLVDESFICGYVCG